MKTKIGGGQVESMNSYSPERKSAILKKLLPPLSMSVAEVSRQENISSVTLYTWRKQLLEKGVVVPDSQSSPEQWSAEAKLAVVAETLALSEVELSEYCRKKSLFPEQVKAWKDAFLNSQRPTAKPSKAKMKAEAEEAQRDKKRIRELEKELRRKERALAETAALLVLRKKLNAFWEEKNNADD
jgi:transposase-like protein